MSELPFDGFKEHIEIPLAKKDQKSFNAIKRLLLDEPSNLKNPFSALIYRLTGKESADSDAKNHWRQIIENKNAIENKLGRTIGIQTSAIDFFDQKSGNDSFLKIINQHQINTPKQSDEWIERVYTPGYHLEKLKEEMMRAKRYKHALSTILLDIDEFRKVNDRLTNKGGDQVLTLLVKIIKKTIRTVDIITRYSGDQFLLILPNTNKREAQELSERIRENVSLRTKKIEGLSTGITITISVGQCSKDDVSMDYIKRLVAILEDGKKKGRNKVYPLE